MKSKSCFAITKSSLQGVRRDKDADIKGPINGSTKCCRAERVLERGSDGNGRGKQRPMAAARPRPP
jgi:hypothetical protein